MSLVPIVFGGSLWDPFESLSSSVPNAPTPSVQIDWQETPDAHIIKADLPGLKKEEVKVEVEDGVIKISGERSRSEKEEKNSIWHRAERSIGKFLRHFRMPDNANTDHVKASMENGVLTVVIPKSEVKKPEIKTIEISG